MPTSIGDLLAVAAEQLRDLHGNLADAHLALAVMAPAGRALTRLADADELESQGGLSPHGWDARELAHACGQAAAAWPPPDSRVGDLIGVAADISSRLAPDLEPAQRWALTVAFTEAVSVAVAAARRFTPYRDVPQLVSVQQTAALLEQQATADRPTLTGSSVLDHLVESPAVLRGAGLAAAAEAAVALGNASHASAARGTITLIDLLATAAAAETATRYATTLLRIEQASEGRQPSWAAAPAAWRAVTLACAPFDDGTKTRPTPSRTLNLARRLDATLRSSLGPADAGLPERLRQRDDRNAITAHLRVIASQLPDLATQLNRAAIGWIAHRSLAAPERLLPSYERRNYSARAAGNRIVLVEPSDLGRLLSALDDARLLGGAISHALGPSPPLHRHADTRASATTEVTAQLQRTAVRATLRAGATGVNAWAFPRPDRPRGAGR